MVTIIKVRWKDFHLFDSHLISLLIIIKEAHLVKGIN